jgi:hypothetical protein
VIACLLYVGVDVIYSSSGVMFIKERGRVWGFIGVLSPLRKVRFFSDLSVCFLSVFSVLNRDFSIPRFVCL